MISLNQLRHRRPYVPTHGLTVSKAVSVFLGLSLALLHQASSPADAIWGVGEKPHEKTEALPQQDFLPPVATINGSIQFEESLNKEDPLEPITLSAVDSPVLKINKGSLVLDNDLGIKASNQEYQTLLRSQKDLDAEDLKKLWEATVERNPVIRFSLEKLSTPPDLQQKKSSQFMNKTLNVLISGVTMAATMAPGGSYYRNMAAFTAGDSMRNMINVKNRPRLNSLSATEQIQLAGLVDDLQGKLVKTYHTYKNGLQSLIHAHQTTLTHNDIYRKALQSGNDLAILAAGSAYYKSLLAEAEIRQDAKINRLRLERLAGEEVLSDLKLSVVFNADLHDPESLMETPSPQSEKQSLEKPLKPSSKSSSVSTPAKTSEASSLTPEPDRIDHDETH